jgi:hypothetical protein
MCYRMALLHHVNMEADAIRFAHYVLLSMKNITAIKRSPSPSEARLRPGGRRDWMVTNAVVLGHNPYKAHPFFFGQGLNFTTHTKAIGEVMGKRLRRYAIDAMGLTIGFREELESINQGKLTEVDMSKLLLKHLVRDKQSPHRCQFCGAGDHHSRQCTAVDLKCVYPRCGVSGHVLATCPVLIARCPECKRLGHLRVHCTTVPWMVLWNDFRAGAPFHDLGMFATEKIMAKMYLEDGDKNKFVALCKVDYENKVHVPFFDRFKLSVLPYELPY